MKPVDNASINNKFVYDTSNLSEQELKFFNSIFSASVNDNNIVEASDFVDYKKGANSFIDNLIIAGAEWTKALVDKIILSKNAIQKSENKEFSATTASVLFTTKDKSNDENLENIIEYLNASTRQLNLDTTRHELVRYLRSNNPEVVKILITALNNKKENPDFIKLLLQDYNIDASRLRYELEQLADKDGRSGNSIISDDLIIGDTLDKYKNQSVLENINSTSYTEGKNEVADNLTSVNKNTVLAVLALMDTLDDKLKEINTSLNATKEILQKDGVIQSKAVSYSDEGTKVVSNDVDLINCTVNLQCENGEIYPLKV
ncbi:hypothetical protein IKB17_01745, partial [bacterium]|nr:hypothetical protein [bacterium]